METSQLQNQEVQACVCHTEHVRERRAAAEDRMELLICPKCNKRYHPPADMNFQPLLVFKYYQRILRDWRFVTMICQSMAIALAYATSLMDVNDRMGSIFPNWLVVGGRYGAYYFWGACWELLLILILILILKVSGAFSKDGPLFLPKETLMLFFRKKNYLPLETKISNHIAAEGRFGFHKMSEETIFQFVCYLILGAALLVELRLDFLAISLLFCLQHSIIRFFTMQWNYQEATPFVQATFSLDVVPAE